MKHALHNLIFTVGLVTTAVYTVKAINVVLPIARQIIEETVAEKITDAILVEDDPEPKKADPKKASSHVEFTVRFPRRNKK